jgi:hypothetical protein
MKNVIRRTPSGQSEGGCIVERHAAQITALNERLMSAANFATPAERR